MKSDILIIGGGLCGLSLARRLHAAGADVRLVEARDRLGGRILTKATGGGQFDLGPAWFWPGQPRIEALVAHLGLDRFDQFATGAQVHEDERGRIEHGHGFASMEGSWRVVGGLGRLIDGLAQGMPTDRLHLAQPVTALTKTDKSVTAMTETGEEFSASRIILALPPRIAATLQFAPALPDDALQAMGSVVTWMAGQAKALAVYDRPFWREAGLSGDAISRRGPMVEIHDASPVGGGPFALFGFVGLPAAARGNEASLKAAVPDQLQRVFGPEAANPVAIHLKDWAFDRFTATARDREPIMTHPRYGLPRALVGLWDGRLIFSGTETAPAFGGYLEGALEAADIAFAHLERQTA